MGYITGLADRAADVLDLNVISTMLPLCKDFCLHDDGIFVVLFTKKTIVKTVISGPPLEGGALYSSC